MGAHPLLDHLRKRPRLLHPAGQGDSSTRPLPDHSRRWRRWCFQPIDADDVGRAAFWPQSRKAAAPRQLYEIGGPDQVTLEQITVAVAQAIDKEWFGISKRKPLHLDPRMIRPGALLMDKLLSDPLVTPQQLDMLAKPNITRVDAVRTQFGFEPRPMWGNLGYLKRPSRWPKMAA